MATHSPAFISPSSISYVSRVFISQGASKIVRLNDTELPLRKNLFSIVNSQNNERLFFADKVVLVEGISDRIFFEAVGEYFNLFKSTAPTCEIIDVGGKNFFASYEKILNACKVPYAKIADRDYCADLGDPSIKSIFEIDHKAIKKEVVDSPSSSDGRALAIAIENAILTKDTDELQSLWVHITARKRKIRDDATPEEIDALHSFIANQGMKGTFILREGALENYLPTSYRSKDVDQIIELTTLENFWSLIPAGAKTEIEAIVHLALQVGAPA